MYVLFIFVFSLFYLENICNFSSCSIWLLIFMTNSFLFFRFIYIYIIFFINLYKHNYLFFLWNVLILIMLNKFISTFTI
ncbi:hypothetical protein U3516DRAFT_896547 [Neocallimastix sp. 'constans']